MSVPGTDGAAPSRPPPTCRTASPSRPQREHPFRRLLRDPVAVVCLVVLALLVLVAIFGPALTTHDPNKPRSRTPSRRRAAGIRSAPTASAATSGAAALRRPDEPVRRPLIAVVVAVVLGVTAGPGRRLLPRLVRRRGELGREPAHGASRRIVVLLVVLTAVERQHVRRDGRLRRAHSPGVYRLVRASVTVGARGALRRRRPRRPGLSDARIMRRHILPVVQAPTIIQAAGIFGVGHRRPGRPAVPRPRLGDRGRAGARCSTTPSQHLPEGEPAPLARPGDRADRHRLQPARQRAARRARGRPAPEPQGAPRGEGRRQGRRPARHEASEAQGRPRPRDRRDDARRRAAGAREPARGLSARPRASRSSWTASR